MTIQLYTDTELATIAGILKRAEPGEGIDVGEQILNAIAPHIAARALRNEADFIVSNMAQAWGGEEMWLTNGSKVADVTAGVLREAADEIETRP